MDAVFSREQAAGWDPQILGGASVLLLGGGALGQNAAVNLALAQVRRLWIVDMDDFTASNATRSPFFPNVEERQRWGAAKAVVVAQKVRQMVSWSDQPDVFYSISRIQELGDLPFRWANVAISAVDNDFARAYISGMAKKHGVPLVEGGFDGTLVSYGAFPATAATACWRCAVGEVTDEVRFSCDAYAAELEEEGVTPATQPAAAALAALMTESAIRMLHKQGEDEARRVYLDVVAAQSNVARIGMNPECSGRHHPVDDSAIVTCTAADQPVCRLLAEVQEKLGASTIILDEPLIRHAPCRTCRRAVRVEQPRWKIGGTPACRGCGGNFPRLEGERALPVEVLTRIDERTELPRELTCRQIGIAPGSILDVISESGASFAVEIPGRVEDLMVRVPVPQQQEKEKML